MSRPRQLGRIAFTPTAASRAYFDDLVQRLTRESRYGVRVTQREAFARMVELAIRGERAAILPPLKALDKPA